MHPPTAHAKLQLSKMDSSSFKARPPLVARGPLATVIEPAASAAGLAIKTITEHADSYNVSLSYPSDDLGEYPHSHEHIKCPALPAEMWAILLMRTRNLVTLPYSGSSLCGLTT